jgi:hypothetical protein
LIPSYPSRAAASWVPSTRALIFAKAVARAVDVSSQRGEPAVVRRSELVERDVLGCFDDAIADLLGRLDRRVDWIDDSDEDPLARLQVGPDRLEHRGRSGSLASSR